MFIKKKALSGIERKSFMIKAAILLSFIFAPSLAEAGIPSVRSLTLLYWSDPFLIAGAASIGFVIALKSRLLPESISTFSLYLLLIPITVAIIPMAWMLESAIEAVADPFHFGYSDTAGSLSRWLATPTYFTLDSTGTDRSILRLGLLVFSFVVAMMYQTLLFSVLAKCSRLRNQFFAALTITGIAYGALLALSLTRFYPYTDLIWPH